MRGMLSRQTDMICDIRREGKIIIWKSNGRIFCREA